MLDFFTPEQKALAGELAETATDKELFDFGEEVFELLKAKLEKIRRRRLSRYSNKKGAYGIADEMLMNQ